MPDLWMPGATKLDLGDHEPTDGGPAKAAAHITWDRNASAAKPQDIVPYENLRDYFAGGGKGVAPHILWDPFTGRFTQFAPATARTKSLADGSGGTRTNRAGRVVIQVEALFFPYCRVGTSVYARLVDTPCKGWPALNAWIRSWGVPDAWPMGRPTDFTSHRSESTWETHAGWYAHAHVPENDHQDPGSWPQFVVPAQPKPATPAVPKPAAKPHVDLSNLVAAARRDPGLKQGGTTHPADVRLVEAALKSEGLLPAAYAADGAFGSKTVSAYAAWQRRLGYVGAAADGIPGKTSLTKLGTRHGFTVTA
jgi:hypothetical protein